MSVLFVEVLLVIAFVSLVLVMELVLLKDWYIGWVLVNDCGIRWAAVIGSWCLCCTIGMVSMMALMLLMALAGVDDGDGGGVVEGCHAGFVVSVVTVVVAAVSVMMAVVSVNLFYLIACFLLSLSSLDRSLLLL